MRITRLDMDNFGPFNGRQVDGFSSGLTIVHGENEAGKSALRGFMRVILFGFPRARSVERAEYFYEPALPGGAGGSVHIADSNGDPFSINRVEGVRGGPVTISGARDGGDDLLRELVGGVDDAFYQNVFSISLTQLQSFEALGRGEITERIYSAGLGMGNVSLGDVTRNLDDRISKYRRVRSGSLYDLEKSLRETREELNERRIELSGYDRLSAELQSLEDSAEELDEQLTGLRTSATRIERILELRDPWLNLQRLRREISELPETNAIPLKGVERLDGYLRHAEGIESRLADGDRRDRERGRRDAGLPVVETFMSRESDVREATSQIGYYQEAVQDIPKREAEASEIEAGVLRESASIGPNWTPERISTFSDSTRAIEFVQSGADARAEVGRRAIRAREDLDGADKDAAESEDRLRAEEERLTNASPAPVESMEALERKRDRLATLEGALAELETHRSHAVTVNASVSLFGGSLPGFLLAAAGLLGIAIAVIFGEIASAIAGIVAIVAGVALFVTARNRPQAVANPAQPRRDVQDEITSIATELNLQMPVSARAVVEIRNSVGREIDRKREAAALSDAVNDARRSSENVETRRIQLTEKLKLSEREMAEADDAWDRLLKQLDLQAHFDRDDALGAINKLGGLAARTQEAAGKRQRVAAMQAQNADTDKLLGSIFTDAGLELPATGAGLSALRELERRWEDHVEAVGRRQILKRESDDWGDERIGLQESLGSVKKDIEELLNRAGCESHEQFRELAAQAEIRWRLDADLEALKTSAPDLFGSRSIEIHESLDRSEPEQLRADLVSLKEQLAQTGEKRDAAMIQAGEVRAALKRLETEAEVARLHARIDELTEQLREEAREWSVLTVARSLLDQTREEFQEQRQPSLLHAASGYFSKMTLGGYSGVRAVIGEERFEAISSDGRIVPPEHLSRGAAEQLWLSIRFALVDEYAAKSPLPVVLDDLLVNFDPQRARAACSAISALAQRQQVIFLTCQPSTVTMLQEAIGDNPGTAMSLIELSQAGDVEIRSGREEPDVVPAAGTPAAATVVEPSETPPPRMQPLL
ncbi:MAG: AAA family ATPase [Dehalococcoidia bacterium]|jgi:uncharacterized protein YhaN|nr:AAA family ATPase [Dehalococcoidia bacterium]